MEYRITEILFVKRMKRFENFVVAVFFESSNK